MKKLIILFVSIILLCGCDDINNTPTKQVESFFNNYQTLDSNVLTELDAIINNEEMFDEDQKVTLKDIGSIDEIKNMLMN